MLLKIKPYCPSSVEQKYQWAAEYRDKIVTEFEEGKARKRFDKLDTKGLRRLALIGEGHRSWVEVTGATFNIRGNVYEIVYRVGKKEYPITGTGHRFDDITTRKRVEVDVAMGGGTEMKPILNPLHEIRAYCLKATGNIAYDGLGLNVSVEYVNEVLVGTFLDISMESTRDMGGNIVLMKNGDVLETQPMALVRENKVFRRFEIK